MDHHHHDGVFETVLFPSEGKVYRCFILSKFGKDFDDQPRVVCHRVITHNQSGMSEDQLLLDLVNRNALDCSTVELKPLRLDFLK